MKRVSVFGRKRKFLLFKGYFSLIFPSFFKGETALHIAVRQKDYASVKLLVNAKADLNEKTGTAGQTPLHLAVEYDSEQIVGLLLSQVC